MIECHDCGGTETLRLRGPVDVRDDLDHCDERECRHILCCCCSEDHECRCDRCDEPVSEAGICAACEREEEMGGCAHEFGAWTPWPSAGLRMATCRKCHTTRSRETGGEEEVTV